MTEPEDTLAEWLFYRFGSTHPDRLVAPNKGDGGKDWEDVGRWTYDPDTKTSEHDFWKHEAAAVSRSVAHGGFKQEETEMALLVYTWVVQLAHAV